MLTKAAVGAVAALVITSGWAVYTRAVRLDDINPVLKETYRELSLRQHRQTLAGTMSYPAQWRVLGFWLVDGGARLTGWDPHRVDMAVKALLLAATSLLVFAFTWPHAVAAGVDPGTAATLAAILYLLADIVAYASEGYGIYHTNDLIAVCCWFAAVNALWRAQWGTAALAIFIGAWAKETVVLAVVLAALESWSGRLSWRGAAVCAVAFLAPTLSIRSSYPAPVTEWAWWTANLTSNLPFYSETPGALGAALRNDVKVVLYLHVAWIVALRSWWNAGNGFIRSLGTVIVLYLLAGFATFMFRELRHFLATLILVLPLTTIALLATVGRSNSNRHDASRMA